LIVREAIKNMKDMDLSNDRGILIEQVIPFVFAIKNNTLEDEVKRDQLSKLGNTIFKDVFDNRITIPVEAFETVIINHIKALLNSSNFMVRTNGAAALSDLCQHIDDITILQKLKDQNMIDMLINKSMNNAYFATYISHIRSVIEFGVGGEAGKYVRSNSLLLEGIVLKLVNKMSGQVGKTDMDIQFRKEVTLLLITVSRIQLQLIRLEYDSEKDAEKVIESRKLLFDALYSVLSQNYAVESDVEMSSETEEAKAPNIVIQPDTKNKDIRSTKKKDFELHQLIIEALAYSDTEEFIEKQFQLYKQMYFSVSWEIRLGILKNLNTLLHTVVKSKHDVKKLIEENNQLESFLRYLVGFTTENGEKFDSNLLNLSKILNTLVQSLDDKSQLRIDILDNIDQIFDVKVKENNRVKKRQREQKFEEDEEGGAVKIPIESQHEMLREENRILTEIMQFYYLMKNTS